MSHLLFEDEPKKQIKLTEDQDNALQKILEFLIDPDSHVMALGGPAGTGKTTMLKQLLKEIPKQARFMSMLTGMQPGGQGFNPYITVRLTSTTHKAADVLSHATGQQATTIHSLMKFRPVRDYDTGKEKTIATDRTPTLSRTLIILDEAGMADSDLFHLIMEHTKNCKVLMVGDPYQLPPVNEDDALAFTEISEQVHLTKIMRQAADNPIIQFSTQFRHAQDTRVLPVISKMGNTVHHLNGDDFRAEVDKAFQSIIHPDDARILAWTNARVDEYNKYIRILKGYEAGFSPGEWVISNTALLHGRALTARSDQILRIRSVEDMDDPILGWKIQFDDTPGIYILPADRNDMIRIIREFKKQALNTKEANSRKEAWKRFYAIKDMFCDLRSAYANTINKSQGSTYKKVFIDLNDIKRSWDKKHVARLMYTGCTRASDELYLYGNL